MKKVQINLVKAVAQDPPLWRMSAWIFVSFGITLGSLLLLA